MHKNRNWKKIRMIGIWLTVIALAPQACANIRGGLTGKVIYSASNPLENAKVSIYDLNKKKTVYEMQTASDGRYEYYEDNFVVFNGYCGPSLKMTVTKSGFNSDEKEFRYLCELKRYDAILAPLSN